VFQFAYFRRNFARELVSKQEEVLQAGKPGQGSWYAAMERIDG